MSDSLIDEGARLTGLHEARKRSNAAILDELDATLSGKKTLLDVGCGPGLFLKDALDRGFHAEAVEPDANVVDSARQFAGGHVRHGYFPGALDADDRFDAIVFNDVFEHIPEAADTLTSAHRHLNPGGVLVLNCPDQNGFFYRLAGLLDMAGVSSPLRRMWQWGLPSPHLWYFRADHLARLGKRSGFTPLRTMQLTPITTKGLRQRVSYVQGQSRALNTVVYFGALLSLPLLNWLPRDTSIVFLKKESND